MCLHRLDVESKKLCALESGGGPECSEDSTKGHQGALMRVVSMDEASRAMATRPRNSNSVQLKQLASAAVSLGSRARGKGRTSSTGTFSDCRRLRPKNVYPCACTKFRVRARTNQIAQFKLLSSKDVWHTGYVRYTLMLPDVFSVFLATCVHFVYNSLHSS